MTNRFKMPIASLLVFLLTITAVSLLVSLPYAAAGENTLFIDQAQELPLQDRSIAQAKIVAVNWQVLENSQAGEIEINLFDGETIMAVHERTDPSTAAGGYVWIGQAAGDENSAITLSVVDEVLSGSIWLEGIERYAVGYQNGRHVVQKIDPARRIEVEGPDTVPVPVDSIQSADDAAYCEDGSVIDLLIAYTPAARQVEGGTAAIEALLNQRVAYMNTANINSGLSFRFRLVQVMEATGYVETGDVQADLQRLRTYGDGYLDDVIQARDQYSADLVSLVIAESKVNNSCGVAYLMRSPSTYFADYAFNVSALDYTGLPSCNPLTMAHEFGHTMGNQHDRANASSYGSIYPYSYGYQSPNQTFRTIMAYQCSDTYCPRINNWSNPHVLYNGEPIGVDYAVNPGSSADNALSMSQTAPIVANFRENCAVTVTPTPTPTPTVPASSTATATYATTTPVASTPEPTSGPVTPTPDLAYHIAIPLILDLEG